MIKINVLKCDSWCEDFLKNIDCYLNELLSSLDKDSIKIISDPFNLLNGNLQDLNEVGLEKIVESSKNLELNDAEKVLEIEDGINLEVMTLYNEIIEDETENLKNIRGDIEKYKGDTDKETKQLVQIARSILSLFNYKTYSISANYNLKDLKFGDVGRYYFGTILNGLLSKRKIKNRFITCSKFKQIDNKAFELNNGRYLFLKGNKELYLNYVTNQYFRLTNDLVLEELDLILKIFPAIRDSYRIAKDNEKFRKTYALLRDKEFDNPRLFSEEFSKNIHNHATYYGLLKIIKGMK